MRAEAGRDDRATCGFAVLYRWRVHPGREDTMREAWAALTRAIAAQRGGLGSRLHAVGDGWYAAYAQWPDRETWRRSASLDPADPEAADALAATIAERAKPLELSPELDLLHSVALPPTR